MTIESTETTAAPDDAALKGRHRTMWASGHYDRVAREIIPVLGERLVASLGITAGERVLDVAAGTGNAAAPAARAGASVVASDLTPELLDIGRAEHPDAGIDWQAADAEALPWPDASYDVVMSTVGVMFAPHHQVAADEVLRVLRPGGRLGLLSWTPEGFIGRLFATMRDFVPPPPAGVQPPPLWGSEAHVRELFGDRVEFGTLEREVLEITAFERPRDYGEHFKACYGPTIAAQANARRNDREEEFVEALDAFCDEWNRGTPERARFEQEYLLAVGTRA
jgi:SAM-dependent methyltransferase